MPEGNPYIIQKLLSNLSRSILSEMNNRINTEVDSLNKRITDLMVMSESRISNLEVQVRELVSSQDQPYDVHVLISTPYVSGNQGDDFCDLVTAIDNKVIGLGGVVSTIKLHLQPVDAGNGLVNVIGENSSTISITGPNFIDARVSGSGRLNVNLVVTTTNNQMFIILLDHVDIDKNHVQFDLGGKPIPFEFTLNTIDPSA